MARGRCKCYVFRRTTDLNQRNVTLSGQPANNCGHPKYFEIMAVERCTFSKVNVRKIQSVILQLTKMKAQDLLFGGTPSKISLKIWHIVIMPEVMYEIYLVLQDAPLTRESERFENTGMIASLCYYAWKMRERLWAICHPLSLKQLSQLRISSVKQLTKKHS